MPKRDYASELSIDELRQILSCDFETGALTWLVNRRKVKPGDRAKRRTPLGYYRVGYKGRDYLAHRVVWALYNGAWPPPDMDIDHIDGDPANNAINNLRVCHHGENMRNRGKQANNKTGFKGVRVHPLSPKFNARIQHKGVGVHLGMFDTAEEAHEAYCKAARELHGNFAKVA